MTKEDKEHKEARGKMAKLSAKIAGFGVANSLVISKFSDTSPTLSLNDKRNKFEFITGIKMYEALGFVAGSTKFKQVVLSLEEEAHTEHLGFEFTSKEYLNKPFTQASLRKIYGKNVPQGTKFSILAFNKHDDAFDIAPNSIGKDLTKFNRAEVVAKIPAARQYFLVGKDEKHMFICNLPKAVKSVAEAHQALIPKECIGKDYVRQGEFFFLPVPNDVLKKIFDQVDKYTAEALANQPITNTLGEYSDHEASILIVNNADEKQFVMGKIENPRHKTVILNSLHEVFFNNEIPGESDSWD